MQKRGGFDILFGQSNPFSFPVFFENTERTTFRPQLPLVDTAGSGREEVCINRVFQPLKVV